MGLSREAPSTLPFIQDAKVAVAGAACHPAIGSLIGALTRNQVPNGGLRFDTSDPRISGRVKAQLFFGLYERAEVRFIRTHLPADRNVVELGASLGVTGSHILQRLGPRQRLVSVEANPELVPLVESAFEAHGRSQAWVVKHAAVSYAPGPALLSVGATSNASHLAVGPGDDAVEVPATTLSTILDEHGLDRFALVCDIEGAEHELVDHDTEALARCDAMVIELHDHAGISMTRVRERLLELGFRLVAERGPVLALTR